MTTQGYPARAHREQLQVKEIVREEIQSFCARYQKQSRTATRWREPLVGFASARDPLFEQFASLVCPTHSLPDALLPGARTVVAFFLPFETFVAQSNIPGVHASREWATAYIETNTLIGAVCRHMGQFLGARGCSFSATPPTHNFDREKLVSNWSHRHVAVAAGLDNFGRNNMLITESGCCGRLGSFLTSLWIPPDRRIETETCLHRRGSSCLRCVERCVNDALRVPIHSIGNDATRCASQTENSSATWAQRTCAASVLWGSRVRSRTR